MEDQFWASLDGLLANAENFARHAFKHQGEVVPMFIAVHGGHVHVIAAPWRDEGEKHVMVATLREEFRELGIERFAFMVEAWMVAAKPDADLSNLPRPSEHPDRQEVVHILAMERGGGSRAVSIPILRKGRKASLGEATRSGDAGFGLFTTLLDDRRTAH